MARLGEDISEVLDYVPGHFQVIRHVRPKDLGQNSRIARKASNQRRIRKDRLGLMGCGAQPRRRRMSHDRYRGYPRAFHGDGAVP
jgi:hypothetical protein